MPTLAHIVSELPSTRFSDHVRHYAEVDSTNLIARRLGRAGARDGTVVVADAQTRGYGRRQRAWVSPAGVGLYVSVLLRPARADAESGPAVQLVAGIAAAEALATVLPAAVTLRWPNDCFVGDHKIAGVLVEAETTGAGFDFLVCGIGININQRAADFPPELRDRATSVRLQVGHEVARNTVLGALLRTFEGWEATWRQFGLDPIRARWMELSPQTSGGRVSVRTDAGVIDGSADGLAADGRLRVRSGAVVHELGAGEVIRLHPA